MFFPFSYYSASICWLMSGLAQLVYATGAVVRGCIQFVQEPAFTLPGCVALSV